ncbi:hypothetical protein [Nonomuraea cavernae]|uniref:hypothetical protein n=1 Tax=Nonomuraea cavernae TaxID=2045107 RepID=UPI0033DCE9D8
MDVGGRERFITGATLAAASAAVLGPAAAAIAAILWTLVANPGTMADAKDKWQNNGELDALQESVNDLNRRLTEVANWEGGTAETVKQILKQFVTQTVELAQQRTELGNVLGSSAKWYDRLSWFVLTVGTAMMGLVTLQILSNTNPLTFATVPAAIQATLQALRTSIMGLGKHMLKFGMAAVMIVFGIQSLTAQMGMKFQGLQAGMHYQGAKLTNDPKSGALTPVMDTPKLT